MAHEELKEEISEYLSDHGITIAWLAKRINLSRTHLHNVLRGGNEWGKTLTPKCLGRINQALKTDFKFVEAADKDPDHC